MADVITGNTELGATKQALISALVQKELAFNAGLLPFVTDVSMYAVKGAKSISFPKLTSFTVEDRATATAGTKSALTSSVDTLNLDINAYVSWLIDSSDEIQSSINAQVENMKRAAAAHGRYVDSSLLTKIKAATGYNVDAAVLTRDIVLDMREKLLTNNASMSDIVLVISPTQEKAMLKITEFTQAQVYGGAVIPNGMIGKVYGIPVIVHNGMPAGEAYMWEKSGVAIGFQKGASVAEQPAIEYGTSAKLVAVDQLFGISGLQLTAGASPLIVTMVDVA